MFHHLKKQPNLHRRTLELPYNHREAIENIKMGKTEGYDNGSVRDNEIEEINKADTESLHFEIDCI